MKFRKNSPKASLLILFAVLCVASFMVGVQFVNLAAANPLPYEPTWPTIVILSPKYNKTYTANNVSFAFVVGKPASWYYGKSVFGRIIFVSFRLDGREIVDITQEMVPDVSPLTMRYSANLTGLSEGTHSLVVSVTSTSDWTHRTPLPVCPLHTSTAVNSSKVYFTIAPPSISILSPEDKNYNTTHIQLNFTVNEPVKWIGYSLDKQANITITGNTTLTGLSNGLHNITVYANDIVGNTGTSATIYFTIAQKTEPQQEPFPTTWIVTAIAIIAIGAVAFLVYFRKIKKTHGKAEKTMPEAET